MLLPTSQRPLAKECVCTGTFSLTMQQCDSRVGSMLVSSIARQGVIVQRGFEKEKMPTASNHGSICICNKLAEADGE